MLEVNINVSCCYSCYGSFFVAAVVLVVVAARFGDLLTHRCHVLYILMLVNTNGKSKKIFNNFIMF